jgi:uncharacterized membrane protein HdeD (DUF308 family)
VTDRRDRPALAAILQPRRPRLVVLITALRAFLAFAIGAAMLVTPDRGAAALAGFMGIYFLVSGLFSLAWARRGPFLQRLALVSGCVGIATGVLVLAQRVGGDRFIPSDLVLPVIGVALGLTGILHLAGGFMIGERIDQWPAGHVLLGLIEIVLGAVLVAAPSKLDLIAAAVVVWSFAAGSILTFDALRVHRRWRSAGA